MVVLFIKTRWSQLPWFPAHRVSWTFGVTAGQHFLFRGWKRNNWISLIHYPIHFFPALFIIPSSILLDIHYSVSILSSNFDCIDVAILSALYSKFASPAQCSPKIARSKNVYRRNSGIADWNVFFFSVMRKKKLLNTRRIALILLATYGIDDNTFDKLLLEENFDLQSSVLTSTFSKIPLFVWKQGRFFIDFP